jgi:hypothetical protein
MYELPASESPRLFRVSGLDDGVVHTVEVRKNDEEGLELVIDEIKVAFA